MACIDRFPNCGVPGSSSAFSDLAAILGIGGTAASVVGGLSTLGALKIGGIVVGGSVGAVIAAALAAIAAIILFAVYWNKRCSEPNGLDNICIAGCVSNLHESFSSATDTVFPFTAMPNRVDVTVKSAYWNTVEQGGSTFVFCTDDQLPRKSEIMHCYYYSSKLCAAEEGAFIGGAVGALGGFIAGIAAAAALCALGPFLCLLGLLIAVILVIVAALVGAFAGGNIARAVAEDDSPTGNGPLTPFGPGMAIKKGQLVTLLGNMIQSGDDHNANVLWWVGSSTIHGDISPGTREPFSYCDIDEQFVMDACRNEVIVL